jgi:ATP-dependent Clp protease adapter protein ClpS
MRLSGLIFRVAGSVLLTFGVALAGLLIRILVRHSAWTSGLGVVVAGTAAISALCLLLGYRLVLNRPNRHGTLLSPMSWKVLAACFALLTVLIAAQMQSGHYRALAPAATAALLAFACLLAPRGVRFELPPSRVLPPETSLLRLEGFAPAGLRHGVEILNDDRTPMVLVVWVLQKILGLNESEATRTMLEIHRRGGVILATESLEESERIAEAVTAEARSRKHPLTCRAVSVEESARATGPR